MYVVTQAQAQPQPQHSHRRLALPLTRVYDVCNVYVYVYDYGYGYAYAYGSSQAPVHAPKINLLSDYLRIRHCHLPYNYMTVSQTHSHSQPEPEAEGIASGRRYGCVRKTVETLHYDCCFTYAVITSAVLKRLWTDRLMSNVPSYSKYQSSNSPQTPTVEKWWYDYKTKFQNCSLFCSANAPLQNHDCG